MARALVTGFEPFRQWRVNSSGEAVRALAAARADVAAAVLPVCHEAAPDALGAALAARRPDVLLLTGLADEARPRLELRARRAAGGGAGAAALHGVWPWAAALDALRAARTPGRLSDDAGLYVCETTYRAALERRARGEAPALVAFLHVPPLSEAWPVARVAAAIGACLDAALSARRAGAPVGLGLRAGLRGAAAGG
jgi:pyroglutamyl-peptidase